MSVVSSQKCRTMLPVRPSRGLSVVCEAGVTGHKAKVRLSVPYKTKFGQSLCVTGGLNELGSWQEECCVTMDWNEGNIWTAECELPNGAQFEYKYILKKGNGSVVWQPGSNIKLELPNDAKDTIDVLDSWTGNERKVSIDNELVVNKKREKRETAIPKMFSEEPQGSNHIVGTGFVDIGAPEDPSNDKEFNATLPPIPDKGFVETNVLSKAQRTPSSNERNPFAETI